MKKRDFLLAAFCAFTLSPFISYAFGPADGCCIPAPSCDEYCKPYYDECCSERYETGCNGFEIGAEWLYWRLRVSDLDYVGVVNSTQLNGVTQNVGTYKFVEPDWESGIRGYMSLTNLGCGWDLKGSYTRIRTTDTHKTALKEADDELLDTTLLLAPYPIDAARAHYRLRYQTADILISRTFALAPCHHFSPFFGAEWVEIDQKFINRFHVDLSIPTFATVNWGADYNGAGLKLGTDYRYEICDGFHVISRASATLTVGDDKVSNQTSVRNGTIGSVDGNDEDNFFRHKQYVFVPGYHIALGIAYERTYCECSIGARIGYEFVQWHGLSGQGQPFAVGTASAVDDLYSTRKTNRGTIGFHGLFAGMHIGF